jgi:hypothetical protein
MASTFTNADGLTRRYGGDGIPSVGGVHKVVTYGAGGVLVVDFDVDNLPGFDKDAGGGSTPDSFSSLKAYLPAGAWIKSATILVKTALAGTTPTLTIGTYEQDGTVIDADGIDAAVAAADLAANKVVLCNGAQVGGTASLAADAYIVAVTGGTATAGAFRLVVEYVI